MSETRVGVLCTPCGEPLGDRFLCNRCTGKLAKSLRDVPLLVGALDDSMAMLAKHGPWIGDYTTHGGGEQPLRVDLKASALADELFNRLAWTVRELCEERGSEYPGVYTSIPLALWLARNVDSVALSDHAVDTYKDLKRILGQCWRHVDNPEPSIFLGPCGTGDCALDIYAPADAGTVVCACKAVHDVAARKLDVLRIVRDRLMTVDELAAALRAYSSVRVNKGTLRKWRLRGKVDVHDVNGVEMFNCGAVLDRIAGETAAA